MKRSKQIATLLLAGVAVATLAACGDEEEIKQGEAKVFVGLEQCLKELPSETCLEALTVAKANHEASAPKYHSLADCEAVHGAAACRPPSTPPSTPGAASEAAPGGDWFMPALMGFMVGRTVDNLFESRPIYRDSRGWAYSGTTPMGFDFDTRQRCANPRYRDDHRPECGAGGRVGSNGVFIHSYAGGSYGYSGGGYAGSTSSPSSSVARVPQSPSTLSARPVPSARIAAPVSRGGFGSMASAHGASSGG